MCRSPCASRAKPLAAGSAARHLALDVRKQPIGDKTRMTKPIELHMWPTPNGLKISIALREMGLPYDLIPVNIGIRSNIEISSAVRWSMARIVSAILM